MHDGGSSYQRLTLRLLTSGSQTTTPGARRPGLVWSEVPVPGESSVIDCESDSGGNVHTPTDDNPLNTHAADSAEVAPASKDDWIKCTQCSYTGPPSSFPLRLNGTGHVRTCAKHTRPRRQDAPNPNPTTLEKISWESLLDEIRTQAAGKIEIDRFVFLDSSHPGAHGETLLIRANIIMDGVKHAAGYRFKCVIVFINPRLLLISLYIAVISDGKIARKKRRNPVFLPITAPSWKGNKRNMLYTQMNQSGAPRRYPRFPAFIATAGLPSQSLNACP